VFIQEDSKTTKKKKLPTVEKEEPSLDSFLLTTKSIKVIITNQAEADYLLLLITDSIDQTLLLSTDTTSGFGIR
jgi:hypothetical protein